MAARPQTDGAYVRSGAEDTPNGLSGYMIVYWYGTLHCSRGTLEDWCLTLDGTLHRGDVEAYEAFHADTGLTPATAHALIETQAQAGRSKPCLRCHDTKIFQLAIPSGSMHICSGCGFLCRIDKSPSSRIRKGS